MSSEVIFQNFLLEDFTYLTCQTHSISVIYVRFDWAIRGSFVRPTNQILLGFLQCISSSSENANIAIGGFPLQYGPTPLVFQSLFSALLRPPLYIGSMLAQVSIHNSACSSLIWVPPKYHLAASWNCAKLPIVYRISYWLFGRADQHGFIQSQTAISRFFYVELYCR